mgnify:FL=1
MRRAIKRFISHAREWYALLRPVGDALRAGRYFTCFIYLVLAPLSTLTEQVEDRSLASDVYVMF